MYYEKIRWNKIDTHLKIFEDIYKNIKIWSISSKTLLNLTEDILDLAKMEAGIFSLSEKVFAIETLTKEINYIFEIQWVQKGLKFEINWNAELSKQKFNSDIGRIKQILMNLISNSWKFTHVGGIFLNISQKKLKKQ